MNYEIYTDDESPYGRILGIRRTDDPPGQWVFSTFAQAKRELTAHLIGEEEELKERLLLVRYNREDVRRLRKRELP